jgi:hypothetical protein
MSDPVSRPTFYEGEILPAADLIATVDYPRNQMARHDRSVHRWGIVTGLDLTGKPAATASGTSYKTVTCAAGIAIDGTGREIVVPDAVQLSPTDFLSTVSPDTNHPEYWYPVFLVGLDHAAPPSSNLTGACANSQPTRTQETYNIVYGNPGDELNLDQQQAVANVSDGPDDGTNDPWQILLGFVQWVTKDPTVQQFADVGDFNPATGIGRRYIGVNAAEVVSGSGSLMLETHPANFTGQNPILALQIQEAPNDGKLVFGKLNPNGQITPVLTVSSNGNLTAEGQISGAVTPGSMQVQSGIAFDGMLLPLPTGVDPNDVASGKVTLHSFVSVHYERLTPPLLIVTVPFECWVDPSTRQIHCRVIDITGGAPFVNILPAWCDYVTIVAVPASTGSGS